MVITRVRRTENKTSPPRVCPDYERGASRLRRGLPNLGTPDHPDLVARIRTILETATVPNEHWNINELPGSKKNGA